ncbi:MAG: hypothetical protein WBL61_09650 [Bryobacteraceae bacterium]
MSNRNTEPPAEVAETLDLGSLLGQHLAFELIGGRCSAAKAASLHQLRENKAFRRVTRQWRKFCPRYLDMSGRQADRIIQLWEELGASYFDIARLTRISKETYRAIAPAIRDGALHCNGEAIELTSVNSRRVAVAVVELRRRVCPSPARYLPMHKRIAALDKRAAVLVAELAEISHKERCGENWLLFTGVVSRLSAALRRIEAENALS